MQKKRTQRDEVIKSAAVKTQMMVNMIETWHLFVSCIHLRKVTASSSSHHTDLMFSAPQWCLSHIIHVRHHLFTQSVYICFSSTQLPFFFLKKDLILNWNVFAALLHNLLTVFPASSISYYISSVICTWLISVVHNPEFTIHALKY